MRFYLKDGSFQLKNVHIKTALFLIKTWYYCYQNIVLTIRTCDGVFFSPKGAKNAFIMSKVLSAYEWIPLMYSKIRRYFLFCKMYTWNNIRFLKKIYNKIAKRLNFLFAVAMELLWLCFINGSRLNKQRNVSPYSFYTKIILNVLLIRK